MKTDREAMLKNAGNKFINVPLMDTESKLLLGNYQEDKTTFEFTCTSIEIGNSVKITGLVGVAKEFRVSDVGSMKMIDLHDLIIQLKGMNGQNELDAAIIQKYELKFNIKKL
ncbi:hypothetical protein ABEW34_21545 [Paenibacillus algorifonticola]|uniref:hypothetical protein n=1 Tax=Paenibacillus algorifonticola TaxID=684063 RepID=UPI003D2DC6EA